MSWFAWPFIVGFGWSVFVGVLAGFATVKLYFPGRGLFAGIISGILTNMAEDILGLHEPQRIFLLVVWAATYLITCFFLSGGGGKLRRLLKKTSVALRKLVEKVKELAPTPAPQPAPAG